VPLSTPLPGAPGRVTVPGLLGRGLAAGLAGGLVAALVGLAVAWPLLDQAVELEAAAAAAHAAAGLDTGHDGAAPLSRGVQRVGGVVGIALVGAVAGLLLALGHLARRGAPGGDAFRRSLLLGTALLVAVVAVPQLRYPPLPPGSDAEGGSYTGALLLGVAVVALWTAGREHLRARGLAAPLSLVGLTVAVLGVLALGWWALPDRSEAVLVPAALLWDLRVASIALQAVLVLATAAALGVLLDLAERRAERREGPAPAPATR